ncbi:MAG: hypothetical protein J7K75_11775 [Desulfuromonas sp.]|nr:hypothetical protein [Desulfuromonas sp.]
MTDLLTGETLANGVTVEFCDKTNRYYGDYHRVCIEVSLIFDDGQRHVFQTLERMGVSSDDLDSVKSQVVTAFRQGTMTYMAGDQFPQKFLALLSQRKKTLLPGLR